MRPSTGIEPFDELIYGLRPGDNLVWKVDSVADYVQITKPFWQAAVRRGEPLLYFRFALHEELVPEVEGVTRVQLDRDAGFESLLADVHRAIEAADPGTNYVFDMFTDLVRDWLSERMLGNFFLLTCPYMQVLESIAYFGVLCDLHSYHAIQPIYESAQLFIDVYRYDSAIYLHLRKIAQRHSSSMFLFHRWDGSALTPITDSATSTAITRSSVWPGLQSASYRMIGMWDRRFMEAEERLLAHRQSDQNPKELLQHFERLARQVLTNDPAMLDLVRRYLTLEDLIDVWKHVIGSGMIGGKAVGMLVARAILRQADPTWAQRLEQHDSFFVASDVFYSFLVQNDCWGIRQRQKVQATLLDGIEEGRARIMKGEFPNVLVRRFSDMLDYFGQSPIVVRSSSLLEDAFGNAFAGKYDSVFCPNQGTRQQRLEEFLHAVRLVYASSLSEEALLYRAKRHVLDQDEQMALLVQRVSGTQYGTAFYPHLAGVGLSINPFVWSPDLNARAGMLRLVFGLGTRAVERNDDDYTRIVALDAPLKRPEGSGDAVRKFTQRRIDFLDLQRNTTSSGYFSEVADRSLGLTVEWFAERTSLSSRDGTRQLGPWALELNQVLERIPLANDMAQMLRELRTAYGCEVEIEFTVNLRLDGTYSIHLLQCRPFQFEGLGATIEVGPEPAADDLLLRAHGPILGASRTTVIDRIIYVSPQSYGKLSARARYSIARLVGKLVHVPSEIEDPRLMLVGPGRFGTTMPELGIPVTAAEINGVSILCEIDTMHEGLNPDLSLGTHFFHELVENDMLYVGFAVVRPNNQLSESFFNTSPNLLCNLLPGESAWCDVVRVIEAPAGRRLWLRADHLAQVATLYFDDQEPA